jgi:hypothetical protein
MKNRFFLFTLILFVFTYSCDCDKADVPEKVLSSFSEMFPGASDVEWELDDDLWAVEFEWKEKEYEASFLLDGAWYETEFEIEQSSLPVMALKIISNDFAEWEIEEVEFVERADFRGYEVELEMDEKEIALYFNEGGELTSIEEGEEDEEED